MIAPDRQKYLSISFRDASTPSYTASQPNGSTSADEGTYEGCSIRREGLSDYTHVNNTVRRVPADSLLP